MFLLFITNQWTFHIWSFSMDFLRSLRHRSSSLVFKDRFYHVNFLGEEPSINGSVIPSFCVLSVFCPSVTFCEMTFYTICMGNPGDRFWEMYFYFSPVFSTSIDLFFDFDFFEIWFLTLLSLAGNRLPTGKYILDTQITLSHTGWAWMETPNEPSASGTHPVTSDHRHIPSQLATVE